jgi:hypothetical protein
MQTYYATVRDTQGDALTGATVTVYMADGVTVAPSIYDRHGAAQPNPLQSDSAGEFAVAAPDGTYVISVQTPGNVENRTIVLLDSTALVTALPIAVASAQASATLAQNAANAALASGQLYQTTAAGITATNATTNKYFLVISTDGSGAWYLWQNVSGTATAVLDINGQQVGIPAAAAIIGINKVIAPLSFFDDGFWSSVFLSQSGNGAAGGIDQVGTLWWSVAQLLRVAIGDAVFGDTEIFFQDTNYSFAVVDKYNTPIFGVVNGNLLISTNTNTPIDPALVAAIDGENLGRSAKITQRINTSIQRPTSKYSLAIIEGQSYGSGFCACPPPTTLNAFPTLLMTGASVRCASGGSGFTPIGSSILQPLVGTMENVNTSAVVSASAYAAAPDITSQGETMLTGALKQLKQMINDRLGVTDDPTRCYIAQDVAVVNTSIAQWLPGASSNLYPRGTAGVALANSLANADAGSLLNVVARIWIQGENDGGGSQVTYDSNLTAYRAQRDIDDAATTGQTRPAPFFLYQVGKQAFSMMSIRMAHWIYSYSTPNTYLFSPVYFVPGRNNHLSGNGQRWVGNMLGKVMYRTLILGEHWEPLHPLSIMSGGGNSIIVGFHVPQPPLRFASPFDATVNPLSYVDQGFTIADDAGTVTITSVAIVGKTVLQIFFNRPLTTNPQLYYADGAHDGAGCVQDSDSTGAVDKYTYNAGAGQDAVENIASLVNNTYPLNNWLIAFQLPIPWTYSA